MTAPAVDALALARRLRSAAYNQGMDDQREHASDGYYKAAAEKSHVAHTALVAEIERLNAFVDEAERRLDKALTVCRAALRVIESGAYQGLSDEDCDLENSVRNWQSWESGRAFVRNMDGVTMATAADRKAANADPEETL